MSMVSQSPVVYLLLLLGFKFKLLSTVVTDLHITDVVMHAMSLHVSLPDPRAKGAAKETTKKGEKVSFIQS